MSGRARLVRLWWAAPVATAVLGGLGCAVAFAPRLADRVTVPARVSVVTDVEAAGAGQPHATRPRPAHTSRPTPSDTEHPDRPAWTPTSAVVVSPARPIVTSPPPEGEHEADGYGATGTRSPSASPSASPSESPENDRDGDG